MTGAGERGEEWRAIFLIPADRRASGAARRDVTALLEAWGLQGLCPDAELVVSELVSNAVIHAPGAVSHELQVVRRPAGIRLSVVDGSTAVPTIRRKHDGRPGGRGLRIIAMLASGWGHEVLPGGKVVWADLDDVNTTATVR